ncbi:MAG: hypothetical protein M1815_005530 [Lichina confinis]|nr:MAG: hypothetical protein M1815_005530 [Lichina confinis]
MRANNEAENRRTHAVFVFTSLLFFSGYVLQQRTVRDIRASIKPPVRPHASAISSFALEQSSTAAFDSADGETATTSEAWWYPVPTAEAPALDESARTVAASQGAPTAVANDSISSEQGNDAAPSGDSPGVIDPDNRVPVPTPSPSPSPSPSSSPSPSPSPTGPSRKAIRFGNPLLDPRKTNPPVRTPGLHDPLADAGTSDEMRR